MDLFIPPRVDLFIPPRGPVHTALDLFILFEGLAVARPSMKARNTFGQRTLKTQGSEPSNSCIWQSAFSVSVLGVNAVILQPDEVM